MEKAIINSLRGDCLRIDNLPEPINSVMIKGDTTMETENKRKEKTFRKAHFTSSMGCQICIEGDTCPFAKRGYICSLFDLR
jgi:hypothetical protein